MEYKLWVHIQGNEIKKGPCALPVSWGNISGFHLLADMPEGRAKLLSLGWLPYEDVKPLFDPKTQKLVTDSYEIKDDKVTPKYTVEDRDLKQEDAYRVDALLEEKAELEARKVREGLLEKWDGKDPIPEGLL